MEKLDKTRKFIHKCNLDTKSRAWRKADLFTLLVGIHRAIVKEQLNLSSKSVEIRLKNFFDHVNLIHFEKEDDDDVSSYYKSALQATNDRSNRIRRDEIIAQVLKDG